MAIKPSFEIVVLTQRVGAGDFSAVPDLWAALTSQPFDPKRPAEDIVNDLAEFLKPYTPDPEPVKSPSAEDLKALFEAALEVGSAFAATFAESPKPKPKPRRKA